MMLKKVLQLFGNPVNMELCSMLLKNIINLIQTIIKSGYLLIYWPPHTVCFRSSVIFKNLNIFISVNEKSSHISEHVSYKCLTLS